MTRTLELPDWQVAWVRDTVAARCGLYLGGPHEAYLSSQVVARMRDRGLSFGDYARLLQDSPAGAGELQALIERLCIHETRFFRDPEQFDALARFIVPQLVREAERVGRRRLRLVSAGCSTGQEAYSLAMIAAESQPLLGEVEVEVVGFDVSSDAIDKALRGVYPARDVAMLEPWRRELYFRPLAGEFEVAPMLRRAVRWLRCNLTNGLPVTQVDVIFCRNVLIYFQGAQRDALIRNLVAALRRGGFFVAGHADSLQAYRDILEPIRTNGAVFFRRVSRSAAISGPGRDRLEASASGTRSAS
ncbi:MAG TPA: protein-glutamate O-methyltransferase CheR [Candidatus Kryptonia bacterium]|nr:protein-glutamate O-methyltransferase CheR [Candidatus Kryptonia bacterium]